MQDKWSIRDVADTLAKHGLIVESCDDAISRNIFEKEIWRNNVKRKVRNNE